MNKWLGTLLCGVLAGCAGLPDKAGQTETRLYRCENDVSFKVRFLEDSAVLDGSRGYDVLYRDAGGLTPRQTVYSNPRMRVEFGLGQNGREAILRYPMQPLVVRCISD